MKDKIDIYFHEEAFHAKDKKQEKRKRKQIQKTDRSRYKKTDAKLQKKNKFDPSFNALPKGRILSILGENIIVEAENKKYTCTLRGALKKDKTLIKNIVAVGDFVRFDKKSKTIAYVEDRFSILSREDIVKKKEQIIAVNIDQVLITASVASPPLKPSLIDRYIIVAKKGKMTPIIVINKIDLLEKNEKLKNEYFEFFSAYENCGLTVIPVSAKKRVGLDRLKEIMKNKASVFSGQSGVGKTSLLNKIAKKRLKTGIVAKKTYKGAHITTTATLIPLKEGGFCIDTPGIKSFGIWQLTKEDVLNEFPEIKKYSQYCQFANCTHINEPNCKVKEAVEQNKISSLRFDSYRSLIKASMEENLPR